MVLRKSCSNLQPSSNTSEPKSGDHYISFYCEDITLTVAELSEKGVQLIDEISDVESGLAMDFVMPGDVHVELYEPAY